MPTKANLKRQGRQDLTDYRKTKVNLPIVFPILKAQNCTKTLSIITRNMGHFAPALVVSG